LGKPVQIAYSASFSHLVAPEGSFPGLIGFVRNCLSVKVENYQFAKSYIDGRWDGFYNPMTNGGKFPTGLTQQVIELCKKMDYDAVVEGSPEAPECPTEPPTLEGILPFTPDNKYYFQWEVVQSVFEQGLRGVIKVPTGGGKNNIAAIIIRLLPKHRVLFLVDSIDLLDQAAERLEDLLGEPIGKIGDGSHGEDLSGRICVSTVQTLMEKKDKLSKEVVQTLWDKRENLPRNWLKGVQLLFADECHLASSDGFYDVLMAFKNAHLRLGLSATPYFRGDVNTSKLFGACGGVLCDVPARKLIELGILADPQINMVAYLGEELDEGEFHKNTQLPYRTAYENFVHLNSDRNCAICNLAEVSPSVLILVSNKTKHGRILYEALKEECPNRSVVYLSGDSTSTQRTDGRHDFLSGAIDILIATPIFNKGVDLPNIETLILAGGGKGHVGVIQRLGRGMRGTAEKKTVTVYDFFDAQCEYLAEHSLERLKIYESEGYDVHWLYPSDLTTICS